LVDSFEGAMKHAVKLQEIARGSTEIIDIRVHYQKWKDNSFGFISIPEVTKGNYLAPCFIFKFDAYTRIVFHNGLFAYALRGAPTMQYYDSVRLRSLPGQSTWMNAMLVDRKAMAI